MLSKQAFNSMLKTLEEPPGHVKFILATTDPQKIPVTVLSRCLQFNLKQLPPALITAHLKHVLEQEQIPFEIPAIALIARAAQGSMRDALSLLDQAIAYSAGEVGEAVVRAMLGAIDRDYLFDLLEALQEQNGAGILDIADRMSARNLAFDAALQELATLLHRIALAQTVSQTIAEDEPERERLLELARTFTAEEIQLHYQIAIHGRDEIELAPDEYAGFTMTLLRMLAFAPAKTNVTREMSDASATKVHLSAKTDAANSNAVPSYPSGVQQTTVTNIQSSSGKTSSGDRPDWATLLNQLNVQGMAQQLAKHCVLENITDRQITLRLSQEHNHLQTNKTAIEKLQTALSGYFAKPIKLNIVPGDSASETPAVLEQQNKHRKQQQASDSITHDRFVREAQSELGADLIEESIKPIL